MKNITNPQLSKEKKVNNDMSNDINYAKALKAKFRVLIVNSSGNSTKTTTGRGLVKQRMQEPTYYKVCCTNKKIKSDEFMVTADRLSSVHQKLMQSTSVIVEVEISAYEQTINRMKEMEGCHDDYDFILVPVINSSPKLIKDSVRTIEKLIEIGVSPNKVRVLFNRASNSDEYFDILTNKLDELKVPYDLRAQVKNYEFYEKLDVLNIKYNDVTENKLREDSEQVERLRNKLSLDIHTHRASQAYFIEAVTAQRAALESKKDHDEVFNMLFGISA